MIYLAVLAVALGVAFVALAFVTGSKGRESWGPAIRWSSAAAVIAGASVAFFIASEVVPGSGDLVNGTLLLLFLAMWLISVPLEIGAVVVIGIRVARGALRDMPIPMMLTALALGATFYRAVPALR